MKQILKLISWVAIIVLILPSILFLAGKMELDMVKKIMLIATVVWFAAATPVMWNYKENSE